MSESVCVRLAGPDNGRRRRRKIDCDGFLQQEEEERFYEIVFSMLEGGIHVCVYHTL